MTNQKTLRQRRGRFSEKADFIRGQPNFTSAKHIVEAAAKQGLQISVNNVYNLRATSAKGQAGGKETWRPQRHSTPATSLNARDVTWCWSAHYTVIHRQVVL
ncbi:MAG TPA: hypothetical protein VKP30_24475 [Polyangiaceae bacterium]|nr:hypothetical protein [Polyangiaceae bacterium]